MEPKYKDLTFKSKEKFNAWLKSKTKWILNFEDKGQDFLRWWVDARGEVLNCEPFQSRIWNGSMIMPNSIKKGEKICFQDGRVLNYKTIKVENIK